MTHFEVARPSWPCPVTGKMPVLLQNEPPPLFLLASLLSAPGAARAQSGQGSSANKLPSVIGKAVETVPFSFGYDGKPSVVVQFAVAAVYDRRNLLI